MWSQSVRASEYVLIRCDCCNEVKYRPFKPWEQVWQTLVEGHSILGGSTQIHQTCCVPADPLQYGMRALLVNEFTAPRWNMPDLSRPGVLLGQSLLNTYDFPGHYW